jgi:tetratricopeptide (TPR) repeat protein
MIHKARATLFAIAAIGLGIFSQPAAAADKWLSIQTRNFRLIGNAGESDIRRAGRTLEEFRSAIAMTFPKMEQTSSIPTTIFVFKNDESFAPYKPLYNGKPANLLAFFQPGEDVNYIAVTATLPSPAIILHEYMHFLLRENIGTLPLWISEGLAEAYSTFELTRQNEFTIGKAPAPHVATLSSGIQFTPIRRLMEVQEHSPEYNEQSKQGAFYAQSWAMVHYLILGPDSRRRNQFTQLLTLLGKGTSFEDGFAEAFQTDYGTLEDEVREYIRRRSSWPMMKATSRDSMQVDVRSIKTVTLTEAESEFYLGDLLLHINRLPDAERHLQSALTKTPNLASAQASLAILRVRERRFDDALALLQKAVAADSKNPIVNFYYAYVLERSDSDAADRYATMRTYAKKAIELAPRHVEAYALLARVNLNSGENLSEAEATLKQALTIAPGRDDIQMLLAQTFLRTERRDDARALLSVIERNATNAEVRRRATSLLDQTEKAATFSEITTNALADEIGKEFAREAAQERAAAPPLPAAPTRRAEETVIEALTPIGPAVEGEKASGLLINLECSDGLTLTVRTDRATLRLHSAQPDKIQFLSYTANVSGDIRCGARNPGEPVTVTYRPTPAGGEPLVVEFTQK